MAAQAAAAIAAGGSGRTGRGEGGGGRPRRWGARSHHQGLAPGPWAVRGVAPRGGGGDDRGGVFGQDGQGEGAQCQPLPLGSAFPAPVHGAVLVVRQEDLAGGGQAQRGGDGVDRGGDVGGEDQAARVGAEERGQAL